MTDTAVADLVRSLPSPACAWIYSPRVFRHRLAALRAALPQATILYAMKACADPAILAAAATHADGIECASAGELAAADTAGAHRLALSGPAKTTAEHAAAAIANAPVTVHIETLADLDGLAAAGHTGPVALRVNRGQALPGTHRMTGTATPFGLDPDQIPTATAHARRLGLDLAGFHLHAVSNCLDAHAYATHATDALTWARATAVRHRIDLRYLNIGGGLGADPRGDQINIDTLADHLDHLDTDDLELVIEPGRYLAAPAGWYTAEIVDLKTIAGTDFALLRGGTHHFRLPAAWGYDHPFTIVNLDHWPHRRPRPRRTDTTLRVCGELCTPRDVLHSGRHVATAAVGDRLVFANAGAYGWEISHDRFLAHQPPSRLVLDH